MKAFVKQILQWLIAGSLAILVCNILLFLYHRPTGWIDRTDSATAAIWSPGTTLVNGMEGNGIYSVDAKGYLNDNLPLAEEYTLVIGSSHVQGKEVPFGLRYSDLLNDMLSGSNSELAVYNCSQDGFYLPDIIEHFYAITQEFPNADNIVIDLGKTDFSVEELENALNQCDFDVEQLGENIYSKLSAKKKFVLKVKEYSPLLSILKKQLETYQNENVNSSASLSERNIDSEAYFNTLDKGLKLIRSQYSGNLYILYHPSVSIMTDGTMTVDDDPYIEMIKKSCEKNNINLIDVSDAFVAEYEKFYCVPYGFSNTTMGEGHLNEYGHAIIADEIYKAMKGGAGK